MRNECCLAIQKARDYGSFRSRGPSCLVDRVVEGLLVEFAGNQLRGCYEVPADLCTVLVHDLVNIIWGELTCLVETDHFLAEFFFIWHYLGHLY